MARAIGLELTTEYDISELSGLTPEAAEMQKTNPRSIRPRLPAHIVFIDGHNASPMDDGWTGLFLSINYIKHFGEDPVFFRRAYYAPFGYRSAISVGFNTHVTACAGNTYVRAFGDEFAASFGLRVRESAPCSIDPLDEEAKIPVLFVRRVHYTAHPRHNGQIVRRLDNEDEIFQRLQEEAASPQSRIRILNGLFSSMTLEEQVTMAQDSCLMVGAHGAGLSHILFTAPGSHMLELRPPAFQRPHFIAYAGWSGATHHDWTLGTSSPDANEVVKRIVTLAFDAATQP